MKRNTLLILTLLMGVIFFALPATACHINSVSVTCDTLYVNVQLYDNGSQSGVIVYSLIINGDENTKIEGEYPFSNPVPGTTNNFDVEIPLEWPFEPCGEYSIEGIVELFKVGETVPRDSFSISPIDVICDCPPPPLQCVRSPGYWKNHPETWPVEEIEIGGVVYSKDKAIALMKTKGEKNKVFTMFRALVAAKLNLIVGSDPSCIEDTIAAADDWMEYNVKKFEWWRGKKFHKWGKKSPWREGEPLYETLDDYNNGLLCAPSCDTVEEENGDACGCRGKVTTLTLQYNGTSEALIKVVQKKPVDTIFSNTVGPGEEFTFVGTDKNGTMGTEIRIFVYGSLNTTIHTSCSQPIGPGLIRGDFEVIEGESREGGSLCPVTSPFTSQCKTCRKKPKCLLTGNFPNPFNPVTTISFSLPQSSHVTLEIYNSLGAKVATLAEEEFSSGAHSVVWNAHDFSTGIYICRIKAGSITEVKKIMFVK